MRLYGSVYWCYREKEVKVRARAYFSFDLGEDVHDVGFERVDGVYDGGARPRRRARDLGTFRRPFFELKRSKRVFDVDKRGETI